MVLNPDKTDNPHTKSSLAKLQPQMERLQDFLLQGDIIFRMKHIQDFFDKTSKTLDESFNFSQEVKFHFEDYI